ncbi:PREDICTED: cytosolic beta-glucosidase isoform X1 [Dipodomys ordii]|uniref:Cytosolic beta-glucosidase n=1 Tax=Dipodomys ordii TaxID=10020 RepID=A0A1S3EL25_DIPOR|nr:PREDICTED: cytosolic beta-glucosidase isoform X1 [Dipodomys ordii]
MAFPAGFGWGAATAAYQVEGGWAADGRGPCVWDTFTHQGGERVFQNQTGDVACGSYTLWEEDLKCIKQLGLTHYRFSLSWSRLLPDGTTGFINQKGIDYYNKIIDDLLTNGVTPVVAIYHFDLPQALEDQGGWLSETIIEAFNKYAQFCFHTFGDRVKKWITINEPNTLAVLAYDMGIFAPGVPHIGSGGYQAAHNLIKAHARSWHSYDSLFRKEQKGMVSLSLFCCWLEPADPNSVPDQEAVKRAISFQLDFFAKPIFIDGDYPKLVKSQIASMSKKQGYPSSRLPEFTEEEKKMIKGTADFFAVQYYTSRLVKHQENKKGELGFLQDVEIKFFSNPSWQGVGWIYVVPWGIRKLLKYIKKMGFLSVTPHLLMTLSAGSISDRHFRNCSKPSMLIESIFKHILCGLFWITLSGTMGTADDLASSTLILKTLLDLESPTEQPESMRRSSETMAWKNLSREDAWKMSPGKGASVSGKEIYFGDDLLQLQVASLLTDL